MRSPRHGAFRRHRHTKEQKIIRAKAGLLELAKQLGNVSQACKMMGYSRDTRGESSAGAHHERRMRASYSTHWNRLFMTGGPVIAVGSCITATEAAKADSSGRRNTAFVGR